MSWCSIKLHHVQICAFIQVLALSLVTPASSSYVRTNRPAHADVTVTTELPWYGAINVYQASFAGLLVATVLLAWYTRPKISSSPPPEFREFQWKYLLVWSMAIAADWLQGPYVYALYSSYGYTNREIAELFVAGFGASMVFGTFMGVVADAWGRKRMTMLYCVLYAASCATKHSSLYFVLMLGRILGGAATSILFSAFECWMVSEHKRRYNFSDALLRYLFGLMFFVQYFTAIFAGLIAQLVADAAPMKRVPGFQTLHYGGYIGPFDLSMVVLLCVLPIIRSSWTENYGDSNGFQDLSQSCMHAINAFRTDWRVSLLAIVVSAFEGSMYSFVFNWTPALESEVLPPPHGLIFSMFMMACMCGSSIFTFTDPAIAPSRVLLMVIIVAVMALGLVTTCVGHDPKISAIFMGFIAFEACVGAYFPAVGTLKSHVVPEEARAGVYNLYRLPLNAVVICILLGNMSLRASFMSCCGFLALAVLSLTFLQPPLETKSIFSS
mmetsp:Transcript_6296/g.10606  ORF Transcript_6296/g.10606 Transcript_6296/m.10606 type:complete len:496 (-) Transcript_6296:45-1532(-)